MFSKCKSLISLDLSNLNPSKVVSMNNMFYECKSLTSLNLSNLDISQTTKLKISQMFKGCDNLKYINLKKLETNNLQLNAYDNIFDKVPENVVICINENTNKEVILSQIYEKNAIQ